MILKNWMSCHIEARFQEYTDVIKQVHTRPFRVEVAVELVKGDSITDVFWI